MRVNEWLNLFGELILLVEVRMDLSVLNYVIDHELFQKTKCLGM